jgi:predicted nucleotidyltransferase component of viral defense system
MMVDKDVTRLASIRTGIGLKAVSKELAVSRMLVHLWKLGGSEIILKGGTAINRIYTKKRFSEDIDLDTTPNKAGALGNALKSIGGFEVDKPRKMGSVLRYDCRYRNDFGEMDKIRVEFNTAPAKYSEAPFKVLVDSFIVPGMPTEFMSYSLPDLLAQKLDALLSRQEGKDIFDLFHALDIEFDRNMLRESLRRRGLGDIKDLKKRLAAMLEDMKDRSQYVGNSTNHYIPVALRPEWKGFIDTLIFKLRKI